MTTPRFLNTEEILYIHDQEIKKAVGEPNIRDKTGIEACTEAPKASFGGEYLLDIFGMAATYISCLTIRHPFVDGNKRTALASALTFLYLNGYSVEESYELELADIVIQFLSKEISKYDIAEHFRKASIEI